MISGLLLFRISIPGNPLEVVILPS
jgi:hypothetical protein